MLPSSWVLSKTYSLQRQPVFDGLETENSILYRKEENNTKQQNNPKQPKKAKQQQNHQKKHQKHSKTSKHTKKTPI